MSDSDWRKAVKRIRAVATDVVWLQWRTVGAPAASGRNARSIVDPEALLLLSLYLSDTERRLERLAGWWAKVGARLLSAQRVKNLLREYVHDGLRERVGGFAQLALEQASDVRWRTLAKGRAHPAPRAKDVGAAPAFTEPAALLLRLRVGFGVGVKADALTFLLGCHGGKQTVKQIAAAMSYNVGSVRRAIEEMAAARLVRAWRTAPASYSAEVESWSDLLDLGDALPPWRYWAAVFPLVVAVLEWGSDTHQGASPYVRSSTARDLVERHAAAFDLTGVSASDPGRYRGEEYLDAFSGCLENLADWMEACG